MKAPILDRNWKWIPASDHASVDGFRQRQRARMREAQRKAQEQAVVTPMRKVKTER